MCSSSSADGLSTSTRRLQPRSIWLDILTIKILVVDEAVFCEKNKFSFGNTRLTELYGVRMRYLAHYPTSQRASNGWLGRFPANSCVWSGQPSNRYLYTKRNRNLYIQSPKTSLVRRLEIKPRESFQCFWSSPRIALEFKRGQPGTFSFPGWWGSRIYLRKYTAWCVRLGLNEPKNIKNKIGTWLVQIFSFLF